MCDYFAMPSNGVAKHPDDFDVNWHPHRGMDILSYIKTGVGRHGDSMGNREEFETPGVSILILVVRETAPGPSVFMAKSTVDLFFFIG